MTVQENEIAALSVRHGLTDEEATALWHLLDIYRDISDRVKILLARDGCDGRTLADVATEITSQWDWDAASDPPPALPRAAVAPLLECLADPNIALAMRAEVYALTDYPVPALALGTFSDWGEEITSPEAKPAMLWLRATAHVLLGAISEAEVELHAAASLDPGWPLTCEELARFASDRGDRDRALELLRRAEADADDPLLTMLKRFEPKPRADVARNDPCWCGSGRHYKKCHMRNEQLPLDERADWLYQKSLAAMQDYPWYNARVVEAAIAYAGRANVASVLASDPLVLDVVLFEGGAFNDFLKYRGYLLPEDELRLATQWQDVKRSVHKVISVHRGEGVTIGDLLTGEVLDVRERLGSTQMKVGDLYCARACPVGDTVQFFGGIQPIPLRQCRQLIDVLGSHPDPIAVVTALSCRSA